MSSGRHQQRPVLWVTGLVIACVLGSTIGVAIGGAGPSDEDIRAQVRDGIVVNCESDKKFRIQYRERAIVERRLLVIEQKANEAIIDVAEEAAAGAPATSAIAELDDILDRLNVKLARLRDKIKIRDVPQCDEIRAFVEQLDTN